MASSDVAGALVVTTTARLPQLGQDEMRFKYPISLNFMIPVGLCIALSPCTAAASPPAHPFRYR
jgi:hypothetical protein